MAMTDGELKKCCQEYLTMVEKIRTTAKIVDGKIYLNQQNRKYLTAWMEANEVEITNCFHCGSLVKKWIEEHYIVPLKI